MHRSLTRFSAFIVLLGLAALAVFCVVVTRGVVAAAEQGEAKPAPSYIGSEQCLACHADQGKKMEKTPHGEILLRRPRTNLEKRGCEACHGPGSAHIEDPASTAARGPFGKGAKATAREQTAKCLQCHNKGEHLFWKGSPHELRNVACTQCHSVHSPVAAENQLTKKTESELCSQCHVVKKAQLQRTSHMPVREGKMTCSDCHNPHGSVTAKMIRANSVNENCYKCHAEKRGPVLWEHPPVVENCLNCHDAHGSIHDKLLKVKRPRLCQQCHVGNRHPTEPHDPKTRYIFNRGCLNCHTQIHGSNHPSGELFLR